MPAAAEPPVIETAAETPEIHADAPETPVGEVYEAALAKERGEPEKPVQTKEKPAKAKPEAKTEKPKAEEAKETSKSPIDQIIEPKVEEPKTAPVEDPLKEFPEDDKKPNWKRAREVISTQGKLVQERQADIARLTSELASAKASPPDAVARVKELEKQLDTYKDSIVAVNIELEPEYRAKFIDGREALVNRAADKLKAYGGDGSALKEALSMPEGRLRTTAIKEALGENIEDVDKNRVLSFVADISKLDDEREDIRKNSQQAWEQYQRKHTAEAQAQNEQAEAFKKSTFEAVGKKLPDKLFVLRELPSEAPEAAEWNGEIKAIQEKAYHYLSNGISPEETTEASYWAAAGPRLQKLWIGERKRANAAEAIVKTYDEAEPTFRGTKEPKKSGKEAELEKSPEQIYKETMASFDNED